MTQWTDLHVKQLYEFLANGKFDEACELVDTASEITNQSFAPKDKNALAAFAGHVKNRQDIQVKLASMACGDFAARKKLASYCLKNLKDIPGDAFIPALNDAFSLVEYPYRSTWVKFREYRDVLRLAWKYPTPKLYHYYAYFIEPANFSIHVRSKKIDEAFLRQLGYGSTVANEKDSLNEAASRKTNYAGVHHFFATRVSQWVAEVLLSTRTTEDVLNMIAGFEDALGLPEISDFGGRLASQLVIQELGYKEEGDKTGLVPMENGLFHSNPTVRRMYFKGVAQFAPRNVIERINSSARDLYWSYARSESVDKQRAELERWLRILEVLFELNDGKYTFRDEDHFSQGGLDLFQHLPWRNDLKDHLPDLVQLIGQHIKVRGADNTYMPLNVKSLPTQ